MDQSGTFQCSYYYREHLAAVSRSPLQPVAGITASYEPWKGGCRGQPVHALPLTSLKSVRKTYQNLIFPPSKVEIAFELSE